MTYTKIMFCQRSQIHCGGAIHTMTTIAFKYDGQCLLIGSRAKSIQVFLNYSLFTSCGVWKRNCNIWNQ